MVNKLINAMKWVRFVLIIIFWVIIIVLSLFTALAFLPCDKSDYKSDDDLMREWMENKGCE